MSRPLRIEFAGGLYHVTSRGDGREAIFLAEEDRPLFLGVLSQVEPADLEGREAEIVTDRAGLADIALPAACFVVDYALPNMLFHLTTAYAIARWEGVKLGKADFDGWHRY